LVSVVIATVALDERLTAAKTIGSIIAVAGVAVVCLSRSGASLTTAIWVVVGAAVVQGVYHPLTKPLLRTRSGLEVATYGMVAGTLMTVPLLPWGWGGLTSATASAWGSALYLGLVPSAVGFVLWGYAVANLSVTTSASLLYFVPAVAVLIAFLWLGEVPNLRESLGGVVILAGVLLVTQGERVRCRAQRPASEPRLNDLRNAVDGSLRLASWRLFHRGRRGLRRLTGS
jgi:drug/metabolite transporter (DMT)-like permease